MDESRWLSSRGVALILILVSQVGLREAAKGIARPRAAETIIRWLVEGDRKPLPSVDERDV